MVSEKRQQTAKWSNWVGGILAVFGLVISSYTLLHHHEVILSGVTDATCNISSEFNCDDVARSEYSEVFGFPLGILGIVYFLSLLVLLVVGTLKDEYRFPSLHTYVVMVGAGVLVSIALFLVSKLLVGVLCPSCLGVYGVCLAQAVFLYWRRSEFGLQQFSLGSLGNGLTYPLITAVVVLTTYSFLKPSSRDVSEVPELGEVNQPAGEAPPMQPSVQAGVDIKLHLSPYSGLGEDYRKGSDQAKVQLVEFADFECPACAQASLNLERLADEFDDRILVVFKNYPLDQKCNVSIRRRLHENACDAAVLARCAGLRGKFWEYHDLIFDHQRSLSKGKLLNLLEQVGVSKEEGEKCLTSKDLENKIKDDIKMANKIGVNATPSIYLNGQKVRSFDYQALRAQIERVLNR